MEQVFICDGIRTPIGRYAGAFSSIRADDLAALPIQYLKAQHPELPWQELDEVILGCANQAGEDNRNVARMAALLAGMPDNVAGITLNRLCASGLDAVATGARMIKASEARFVLAGGVESMSRAPLSSPNRKPLLAAPRKFLIPPSAGALLTRNLKRSLASIACRKPPRTLQKNTRFIVPIRICLPIVASRKLQWPSKTEFWPKKLCRLKLKTVRKTASSSRPMSIHVLTPRWRL